MNDAVGRVGLVFRVDGDATPDALVNPQLSPRLEPTAQALAATGLDVVPIPFVEGHEAELGRRLLDVDGALVWADPLSDAGDRAGLDTMLRHAETVGVWVSARPDVIDRIGTKDALVSTRDLGWGTDTHRYTDADQFRSEFPARLAADGVRVLKASRGNGGRTVWKVRVPDRSLSMDTAVAITDVQVLVQHARSRDGSVVRMSLAELFEQVEKAGASSGWGAGGPVPESLVDQEFVPSITRGIVRCYLVGGEVAGFGRQYPSGVEPDGPLDVVPGSESRPDDVMGLPSSKTMYPPEEPAFTDLRRRLEDDWVPGMVKLLGLGPHDLPALWDIDLFIADPTSNPPSGSSEAGRRYLLCEINASSVTPTPPVVPPRVARYVYDALARRSR